MIKRRQFILNASAAVMFPLLRETCMAKDLPLPTGLVTSDVYKKHDTGRGHPESAKRLDAIYQAITKSGLDKTTKSIIPRDATRAEIQACHEAGYYQAVKKDIESGLPSLSTGDTRVSKDSWQAAILAAGGVCAAVDAVVKGTVRNAFVAARPPGHHATPKKGMGFCVFNNVAIAARYAQKKHKIGKVLIVDWDVHHGNGTQDIFYEDPTVFYFGVHQSPLYPGTGSAEEKGAGRGLDYTLNVPLPAGTGDRKYREVFEKVLKPAAIAFKPDFVLISAGFDAHEDDPLGGMNVTAGFAELTRIVKGIAEQCCKGRLVSILEGGYDLDGLAASVEAHIRILMHEPTDDK